MDPTENQDTPEGAFHGVAAAHGLPPWLTALVDPTVMSVRAQAIEDRLASPSADAGLRFECARVMANYYVRLVNVDEN